MDTKLENKLRNLFWDNPPAKKKYMIENIMQNPENAVKDEQTAVRVLNSLTWYELIRLIGINGIKQLLTDNNINRLYPHQRRIFYSSAKQLLSKYTLPSAG